MSTDFTFNDSVEPTIGYATKKSEFDTIIENTKEIDQRLEGIMFIGGFLPKAGTETYAYDGDGRISVITLATSPIGTITVVYDDGNGGRIDYVEAVLTDPVEMTIRETFSYDEDNICTGSTRTVL